MADVHIWNIAQGVKQSWGASSLLSAVIPVERLFLGRTPADTEYPNATFDLEDVSNYFGGTEYFSGAAYIKVTKVTFKMYGDRTTDFDGLAEGMSATFGWQAETPAGGVTIPNAIVLSVVREVEKVEVLPERVSNEDIICYSYTTNIKKQANRG